jgi:hypothetical protein
MLKVARIVRVKRDSEGTVAGSCENKKQISQKLRCKQTKNSERLSDRRP